MIAERVNVSRGDIGDELLLSASEGQIVAWDIETSSLDWRSGRIATCQLAVGSEITVVQLDDGSVPSRLAELLEDASIQKVFHHAPFDLRFMAHHWKVEPANVACTKVGAKVTSPGREPSAYSLKPTLARQLGVKIDKTQQLSDWSAPTLTTEQMLYAANDVRYLVRLLHHQVAEAHGRGVLSLLLASFEYLPTRVCLDLAGAGDVFAY